MVTRHVTYVSLSIAAVIVVVPALIAVTTPPSTVATVSSLDVHVTFTPGGVTVVVNVAFSPSFISAVVSFQLIAFEYIVHLYLPLDCVPGTIYHSVLFSSSSLLIAKSTVWEPLLLLIITFKSFVISQSHSNR